VKIIVICVAMAAHNEVHFLDCCHNMAWSIFFVVYKGRKGTARAGLIFGPSEQMPGASRLDMKTLLYWFFIFLDCSPRVKTVELFDGCVRI